MSEAKPMTISELKSGVWYSPGYYQAYWQKRIIPLFTPDQIRRKVELKQHREMWVGSIFAASQALSGIQHFVGLPADEPPDVEIVTFTEVPGPTGKPSTKLERRSVEIVRCDVDANEELFDQIMLKNKAAYKDMTILVYAYGGDKATDYGATYEALQKVQELHFHSVVAVSNVLMSASGLILPEGTYAVTQLYPVTGQSLVNLNNPNAFFRYPEVVTGTGRGQGTEWKDMGGYSLLPPTLKEKKKS